MARISGKRAALAMVTVGLALGLVACGSDDKTDTATQSSTTVAATTPTTVAATTTTAAPSLLKTATNAQFGTILTDAAGKTLYTRDSDPAGGSSCTGGCIATWPALLVPAGSTGTLKAPAGVTAALTSFARSDSGTQVLLGGKALYTFSGDSAPGDTKGEGVGNVWHVAKAV